MTALASQSPEFKDKPEVRGDAFLRRQKLNEQHQQLKTERSTWDSHWRELCEQFMPRRKRFFTGDEDGRKKQAALIDGTPIWALGVLEAGMMAGITSPSRRWFKLITRATHQDRSEAIDQYFFTLEGVLEDLLANSNIYKCLPQVYADIGVIGTAVLWIEEDPEDVIRGEVFPPGQYALANGPDGKVDTVFREFLLTAKQIVEKFGAEACSQTVRDAANVAGTNVPFQKFLVIHAVYPNPNFVDGKIGPDGMAWSSCWWEMGGGSYGINSGAPQPSPNTSSTLGFLKESGFYTCPFMCPRWKTHGQDVYGSSPGMEALGDARALQLLQLRALELAEKLARPTMAGPASMNGSPLSMQPGGMNFVDALGAGQEFRPAFVVDPKALTVVGEQIQGHVQRINRAFHADLFLMLSLYDKQQKTATEVNELREEKMLQLGPVVESVFDELLDVLLERIFDIAMRRGLLPPPPDELQGEDIRPQYISVLSQAQKLRGTTAVERLVAFIGQAAAAGQESAWDKLDLDQTIDEYANMLGVPPLLVRADEKVQQVRDARAKVQAQQQQMAQVQAGAAAAKDAAGASLENDNALTRMLGNVGAPNTPGLAA